MNDALLSLAWFSVCLGFISAISVYACWLCIFLYWRFTIVVTLGWVCCRVYFMYNFASMYQNISEILGFAGMYVRFLPLLQLCMDLLLLC